MTLDSIFRRFSVGEWLAIVAAVLSVTGSYFRLEARLTATERALERVEAMVGKREASYELLLRHDERLEAVERQLDAQERARRAAHADAQRLGASLGRRSHACPPPPARVLSWGGGEARGPGQSRFLCALSLFARATTTTATTILCTGAS